MIDYEKQYEGKDSSILVGSFYYACETGEIPLVRFLLIKKPENFDCDSIGTGLILASREGQLDVVRYLLNSPEIPIRANIHAYEDDALYDAADAGHLHIVEYLLSSPELKEHANINAGLGKCFRIACKKGHLEIVKFLLTSTELKEKIDIHIKNDAAIVGACNMGHLNVVKYLLTSKELSEHSNIHAQNDACLYYAAESEREDVVKYLLNSPELVDKPDIHANNDETFKRSNPDIRHFLIFEMNIPKTTHISEYLERNPDEQVEKMFQLRDLNQNLSTFLENNKNKKRTKL